MTLTSRPIRRRRQERWDHPRRLAAVGAATGHFGEMLQGRLGASGPVALVTLPCPAMTATATLRPSPGAPLTGGGALARAAARAAAPGLGGRLAVSCAAAPGVGAGSSTLIGLAALRAAEAVRGAAVDPARQAKALLRIEGAVDPLMSPRPGDVLWASRRAAALDIAPPGPRLIVVGGIAGPGRATDPADHDFADIADLWADFVAARRAGDRSALGAIATESARRNQTRRPIPAFGAVSDCAGALGALGVAAAHTGSTLALLFAPGAEGIARAPSALRGLGLADVIGFEAGGDRLR